MNKSGRKSRGDEVSLFLEKAALQVLAVLERAGFPGLIIHTDVLDFSLCKGDDGCVICLKACPFFKTNNI